MTPETSIETSPAGNGTAPPPFDYTPGEIPGMRFAELIREARTRRGMTVPETAREVGLG